MKLVKQKQSLNVGNHDYCSPNPTFVKHNPLIGGSSKRGLVVGSSGSGKTNVIISLLVHPNGLRYLNIYLYSKTKAQPKYQFLKQVVEPINGVDYYEYDEGDEIITPRNAKSYSVIIFDDVVCCNQNIIRDYYSFGRHNEIDCFYLCQSYSSIPKRLIKDNASIIILFQQDNRNLRHVYNDHVHSDLSFEQLQEMCSKCWQNKHGFMVIDKDSPLDNGRYRLGFDTFFKP